TRSTPCTLPMRSTTSGRPPPARCTRACRRRPVPADSPAASRVGAAGAGAEGVGEMSTIGDIVRAGAGDDRVRLRFEREAWTYAELVDAWAERAGFLLANKPADAPFHVGVLLDNVPEFWMMLGAAALSGATLVGINPTRRGAELVRDLQHTDCA